jgi:MFS family permease
MTSKAKLLIIFALVYFFSPNGLSSLPNQPIAYLLKEVLKLTATQAAYFSALAILGWAIKPLWGFISDNFPIFGSRRKSYLIIVSLLAGLGWLLLALTHNYTVGLLLVILTLSSFAYAFQDVVTDAHMIEMGKKENALTEFQSIQWLAVSVAQIITGFVGGLLAAKLSYQINFSIAMLFPLIVALFAVFLIREPATGKFSLLSGENLAVQNFKKSFFNKEFLLIAIFLFLWNFSPSFGVPFFYYRVDELHFSKIFIGILASVAALGSALGAILFKFISIKVNFKKLLIFSILIAGLGTFFSLIYLAPFIKNNELLAKIISVADGIIWGSLGMIAFLTMLTFAAQKTVTMIAGTMFAFFTAVINLGTMTSQALGGFLYEKIGLAPLIIVSGITSLLILVLVPFLKTEYKANNETSFHNN